MNISRVFILRPIGTSLLAIGVFLLGALARLNLPIAPLPQLNLPIVFVSANQPGASPETMATTVATPLERRFGQIDGIDEITSTSALGSSVVIMQFSLRKKIDAAARDVAAAINASAADLPAGLPSPPVYRKANPNDSPVVILALTSDSLPLSELYNEADSLLAQRISQVKGVSQVDVAGGAQPAVHVQVNTGALASMGMSLDDIRTALTGLTANAPKGALSDGDQTYVLAANDQLSRAQDFRKLIIGNSNGRPVTLDAVAKVVDSQLNPYQAGWFNNQRSVLLIVRKQADANVIETVDGVKALLPTLQSWLPPSVKLSLQTDRTSTIRASVSDVQISLLISIVLVVLVMLLFLRKGVPTAIAGVTVPLSIAATFAVMWLLGYTLDNFSLMALTISVSFVVDDAIVVIENIVRYIEEGEPPLQAALRGGREIGFTVLSMSLSLIAVFIPILFLGGVIGMLFREFAVTLAVSIAVSGVVSLTLTPSLCGRFLRATNKDKPQRGVFRWSENAFDWLLGVYQRGLDWSLRHAWVMLGVTGAAVIATFYLYVAIPKGFFPTQDTGMLQGATEAAEDISYASMVQKQQQAAAIVLADPDVASMGSFLGGRNSSNTGSMFITLKTRAEGRRTSATKVIDRLRPKLEKIVGLSVYLQAVQDVRAGGRGGNAQYSYTLQSTDTESLYTWVPKLIDKLKQAPQLKDVGSDLEKSGLQENIVIDRDAASRLGLTPVLIDQALENAFGQRQILITYTQLNQYHVVLEASPDEIKDPSSLSSVYLKTPTGLSVPLSTVAHYESGITPLQISHSGQFPVVNIDYNLADGVALSDARALIEKTMLDMRIPGQIHGAASGNAQLFEESLKTLPLLLLTALLAVYVVLGMLYESLIHPLTILSTLPSAGIGALLALMVTGTELSIVADIGIILLIGVVKKNAIMMIDFALAAERKEGLSPREAIYQACIVRFRPIMMTTVAAMFGALPLAIGMGTGSELRQPLGIAVFGGLALSQLLTLFTTPVVYLMLDKLAKRNPRKVSPPRESIGRRIGRVWQS